MRKSQVMGWEWWRKKETKTGPYVSFNYYYIRVCIYSGGRRDFYEWEYPYSLCFCDECKTYTKSVRLECLDLRPDKWPKKHRRTYIISGNFCEKCTIKLRRYRKTVSSILETKSLINKMLKEFSNGANQDNRTASPVSRGHADRREERADGNGQSPQHHEDCGADQ